MGLIHITLLTMEEKKYCSLQVIRVEGLTSHARDAELYVEVEIGKFVRKTGVLNSEGEPAWNGTMTFSKSEAPSMFKVRLKKVRNCVIGQTEVKADQMSTVCVRISPFTRSSFLFSRAWRALTCTIRIILKDVDALNRARIEVDMAEKCIERIRAWTKKLDPATGVIGRVIEATDVMVSMVDSVAQIHPLSNVSWQAASALYKLVSHQFHTDVRLIELVDKMKMAFSFSREARSLDDKTELLKPLLKELLNGAAECSRFVQKYGEHGFIGRMGRAGIDQKIDDYTARFIHLRKELDSIIALNMAKEVLDIKLRHQLEVFLDPPRLDASNVSNRPRCLAGTRQEYLDPIMEFLFVEKSPNVLWLTGAAGTGKSTIAVTVSDRCGGRGCPPAYIFFEREKSDPNSVIRSIAHTVALLHPSIGQHMLTVLERNKAIRGTTIQNQFETLLLGPLQDTVDSIHGPVILILDALDECGNVEQRRDLLRLIKTAFSKLPSKVRVLITSRPENDITRNLATQPHIRRVELQHGDNSSRDEVALYLRLEMFDVVDGRTSKGPVLEEGVRELSDAADGLFIWASTAAKMIRSSDDPIRKLNGLVRDIQSTGASDLDRLYATALRDSGISWDDSESVSRFKAVLGLIVLAKEPVSIEVIHSFLDLEADTLDLTLSRLCSLLSYEQGRPIRLHHASFADYLLSPKRSKDRPWNINALDQKRSITERCLDIMRTNLRFNICDIRSSFLLNSELPGLEARIKDNIPPHLSYACRFWSVHMCEQSDRSSVVLGKLKVFAYSHLPYWLEVLSLTECFRQFAGRALHDAKLWVEIVDKELSSFLWSAYKLIGIFALPISQSIPHIYLSAISLWKGDSSVATHYSRMHPIIRAQSLGTRTTSRCIKVLDGRGSSDSVTMSSNGRLIASSSEDQMIRVWDFDTGELMLLDNEVRGPGAVAFSPFDSKYITSCSKTGRCSTWEVCTRKLVSCFQMAEVDPEPTFDYSSRSSSHSRSDVGSDSDPDPHANSTEPSIAYSSDGKRIVSVCSGKVCISNFNDGKIELGPRLSDGVDVQFRAVSANGKYVLGSQNKKIRIWDTDTGEQFSTPFDVDVPARCIAVSPDGKLVVTTSWHGIRSWSVDRGDLIANFGRTGSATSIGFSPDGNLIVSGYWDGEIAIYNADSGGLIWGPIRGHASAVTSVVFSPDAKRVISGSRSVRVWDVNGGQCDPGSFDAHTDRITSVGFSADGKRVVSGSYDGAIRIWDAESGRHLRGPFKVQEEEVVRSVAFSPDGKHLVSTDDGGVCVWDAESGELALDPLEGHIDRVMSAAFSPNGKRIASGSGRNIYIWNAVTGDLIRCISKAHKRDEVLSVSFSPDGKYVVSGSEDKTVRVWDADTGELALGPLKGHRSWVAAVSFSPDGNRIASGSGDQTIRIWDAESGELALPPCRGHASIITSISFSPDGKRIASGSWDNTVRIWDIDTGNTIMGPLEGHNSWTKSVSFSPDGRRVVSGSFDGTIRVWDVGVDTAALDGRDRETGGASTSSSSAHRTGTDPQSSRGKRTFPNWRLHDDGWVKNERGELLIWIPDDMRGTLWRPRNTAVFSCQFSTRLDFTDSPLGEDWAKGYPLRN